jgi:hypothetical protein
MMKRIKFMSILMASLVLGACSNDDDNNTNDAYTETSLSEAPVWQMNWSDNQERPNWTDPDFSAIYENWTILKIQIEEALKPYASEGDLMALFVDGELRGLANPAVIVGTDQTDNSRFVMKAWGNETGTETVNMSLQYYNQTLKNIFTQEYDISLNSDATTGIDEDFIPEFTHGSAKYPVVRAVVVETILSKAGITAHSGLAGVFVGEECRGTATLAGNGSTPLVVYGRSEGESFTLKYYEATTGKLFTIPDAVTM